MNANNSLPLPNHGATQKQLDAVADTIAKLRRISADWVTNPAAAPVHRFSADSGEPSDSSTAPPVRIGTARAEFGDLIDLLVAEPVVIPLLGSQTIAIAGPTDETDIVVTTAALRQVASLAPGVLTLEYFDPLGYSSFDAIDLRSGEGLVRIDDSDHLLYRLAELRMSVASQETVANATLESRCLVVLHDFPVGLDDRCLDEVRWLAEHGPAAGVHLLLQVNEDADGPVVSSTEELVDECLLVDLVDNRLQIEGLEALDLIPDPPLSPAAIDSVWQRRPTSSVRRGTPNDSASSNEKYWLELTELSTLVEASEHLQDKDHNGRSWHSIRRPESSLCMAPWPELSSAASGTRRSSQLTEPPARQRLRLSAAEVGIADAQQLALIPRAVTLVLLAILLLRTLDPGTFVAGTVAGVMAAILLVLSSNR